MGNATITAEEYWGYLIQSDKTPTPLFEQFLLGIANYIKRHVAPWDVHCLTPTKLATFYRLVGGDFDALFLRTPPPSLSFIYQSLGCFQTLQPDHDPFVPPSIPALTPQGFVRWQTVQLLLGPEEHVPLLQKAVKSFEITRLADGSEFPKVLPKTAFPSKPDADMMRWHDGVSQKLRVEAAASTPRAVPATTAKGEHDMDVDASSIQSSIEERSVADAADYFAEPHSRPPFVRPNPGLVHMPTPPHTHPQQQQQWLAPDSHPHHRRRSLPNHNHNHNHRPNPYWSNDARTPTQPTAPQHPPRSRPTTPSTISTTSESESDDDDSSTANSEASRSPVVHYQHQPQLFPPTTGQERRHPAHSPYDPRDFATPQPSGASQRPQESYFDQHRLPPQPPRGNNRALNVRWRDVDHMWEHPGSAPSTPRAHHGVRPAEGRRDSAGGHLASRRVEGPVRGVGGRRYPTDGISWA